MSLLEARRTRDEMKIRVRSGEAATDVSRITFYMVAQEWFVQFKKDKSEKYVDTVRYRLEHYICPAIGQITISNLTRLIFTDFLLAISKRRRVDTASRLAKVLPKAVHKAFANTKDPELLGALLRAIDAIDSPITRAGLQVAAYCFLRVGEMLAATWSEIDLNAATWALPFEHTKRDRELLVPMPRQVVTILRDLRGYLESGLYASKDISKKRVFPTEHPRSGRKGDVPITEAALLSALKKIHFRNPRIPRVTIYGFRHTASTLLHERNENTLWIEAQLAHLDPDKTRRTYNSAEYINWRREMLQRYADFLDSLRDGDKLNNKA